MVCRDIVKVETDKDKLLVEDQLTVTQDGILMFENRVVIPKSLTKATPHCTTKVAPSQLLFRTRTTTAQIPVVKESLPK
ncbi:unnamed protein product [Brachionus calyciflorus]|uniref:Uncharacterized protein n=1 Tax=Brachionus calyciflorus TaxID=104777 RepID=A0A814M064_9BILA|nr:unnamed protein product [Brachionus calyciflorus]